MRGAAVAFNTDPADFDLPDEDKRQLAFSASIAAIHGLKESLGTERSFGGVGMDTRQAEMLAMFNAFLGADFDRQTVRQVLRVQDSLHGFQERLLAQHERHEISSERYVQQFNAAVMATFSRCEALLGPKDFERLFGSALADVGGLIDLQEFLRHEDGVHPAAR